MNRLVMVIVAAIAAAATVVCLGDAPSAPPNTLPGASATNAVPHYAKATATDATTKTNGLARAAHTKGISLPTGSGDRVKVQPFRIYLR